MNELTSTAAAKARRSLVAVLSVLVLALATAGCQAITSTPSSQPVDVPGSEAAPSSSGTWNGVPSEDDGLLPYGATVFDDHHPGIAKLSPDLVMALRQATTDAAARGVEIQVKSGWRSAEYQNHLLELAIGEYGSRDEAARWVATAATSAHVTGDAVDVAPYDAIDWLVRRGAAYGLCQIYGNESWHFELRPEAVEEGCPAMYLDPTHDPRMGH